MGFNPKILGLNIGNFFRGLELAMGFNPEILGLNIGNFLDHSG